MLSPIKFAKRVYITFTVPREKSRIVSMTSSRVKNIVVFSTRSRFLGKLVYCVTFE